MSERQEVHPSKMHIYNGRGYCWCGAHRDDWLHDDFIIEKFGEALQQRNAKKPYSTPKLTSYGDLGEMTKAAGRQGARDNSGKGQSKT